MIVYDIHAHVAKLVLKERERQETLRVEGRFEYTLDEAGMSNTEKLAVIMEEVGEVAKECLAL